MSDKKEFDDSSWSCIEDILPDKVEVRSAVLEDFMWYMGRNKKYKSCEDKIEDYIRHLQLKANPKYETHNSSSKLFRMVDIARIKEELVSLFIR